MQVAQLTGKQKKIGVTLLVVAPALAALWILTRPPATPASAAEDMFSALESGDGRGLYRFLLPDEQKALGLSKEQTERILTEVLVPAYRNLNVRVSEKKFLPGNYEMYFMAPCRMNNTESQFALSLLELTPKNYQTSLTNVYAGIQMTEFQVGKKAGTSQQIREMQRARVEKLKSIGLKGLFDFNTDKVLEWPKRRSETSKP